MFSLSRSALALVALASVSYGFARTTLSPTSLPLTFEENRGQVSPQYQYVLHRGLEALFFRQGVDFVLPARHGIESRLRLEFLSTSSHTTLAAEQLLKAQSNYLLGSNSSQFITHVPNYGDIRYQDIYRGVTLDFYGNGKNLEHDFTIAPNADPSIIAFQLQGAKSVDLTPSGDLLIHVADGTLILKKPVAYQVAGDQRRPVTADFRQKKDGSIGFRVGSYDVRRPLIIDPVFTFSTYLAGTGLDEVAAVATDSSGNIYLTGTTGSTNFPTQGSEQSQLGCTPSGFSNCQNAFITKLDPTGKTLMYSTYLGGSAQDFGAAVAIDTNGNAILGGVSISMDFPHAGSVPSLSCETNNYCYFVASLKPDGSALNYSGLIGGSQGRYTNGNNGRLAVDTSGNAYLTGVTDDSDFDITSGTLSSVVPGYTTMFVLKVDPTGKLLYSTIVPGNAPQDPAAPDNNWFLPTAISVDKSGQATMAGTAGLGLPTTTGVVAPTFPNNPAVEDASAGFVLQLNASASAINYATYVPGTDTLGGMAVDNHGNLYVAGDTSESNLPVSTNAFQKAPAKDRDGGITTGYVAELNGQGTALLAATYLDGTNASLNSGTYFQGLALDSSANVFVGGMTGSSDFPLQNPFTSEFETGSTAWEMVLAEMSPDLSTLKFGSFLSSTDSVYAGSNFSALTVDSDNNLIVVGTTYASDFPTTTGSFMVQPPPPANPLVGYPHSFVSKINMGTAAPSVCPAAWGVSFGQVQALTSSQQTLNIINCGNAALNISSITSSVATISASQSCGSVAPGATCAVTFTFAPVDDTSSTGTVTIADNAAISPQVFQVSGQGQSPDLEPASNPFSLGHLVEGTQGPTQALFLYNRGSAPAAIKSVSISGMGFSIAQDGCTGTLQKGGFPCVVDITFAPALAGNFTGSLTISSNDPVHPQLIVGLTGTGDSVYGVPVIAEVTGTSNQVPQQTLQMNNGPINLVLAGSNFYPQSSVQLNGVAQQATFVSNILMQVTIAASSFTALGELPLTVVNPTPGGGSSAPVTMTTYQLLPLIPNALVSVPSTGLLYAAMPSTDPTNPNTVIPIDPATGTPETPIPVGNNPSLLAASSDGAYLYVANATDLTVQRINLQTNAVDQTFPYPPNPFCPSCDLPPAVDLKSIPGSPEEVVLAQGAMVSLYNASGLVNYVPNTSVETANPTFDSIAFAGTPLAVYALPFTDVQNAFFNTAAITSTGLQYTPVTGANYGPPIGTGSQVVSDGTLLYTDSGEVWNPATQTKVGSFPASPVYETFGDLALDTTLGQIYIAGLGSLTTPSGESYSSIAISSYGQQSLAAEQTLSFPQINSAETFDLVRWGSNGFGFVVPSVYSGASGIYLTRSNALAGARPPNPVPALTSIAPAEATAGAAALTLTVNGTGFISASTINWNGSALATTYVSATQLTVTVPASDIGTAGTAQITVTNPAPGGGTSSAQTFTINAANPLPALKSISPSSATAGGASFTLTVDGTGFISASAVTWNGSALATTYVSATQLTATVPASDIAAAGTAQITVPNPAPGGGTSSAQTFTINAANPLPALKSISPSSATAGGASFTLTVDGAGFISASLVNWSGSALATTYVRATQLTATVPASDIATAGTAQITVTNPEPGGGMSSAQLFSINPAVPGASLSGKTLSFGNIPQGSSSVAQSVTLTNSGTAALAITSIAAAGNFSETNTCGSSLAIRANCQISVTFIPASAAPIAGTLTIADNAPNSPQTVGLSGTGILPVSIGAASSGSTSATVSSGSTATYNLSLIGAAGFNGSVSLSCGGAPEYASCSVNPTLVNVSTGGAANFTVTVTTTSSGSAALTRNSSLRLAGLGITALLLVPLFLRTRKGVRQGSLFLAMICLLLTISACGGGGNNQTTSGPLVTPAGTYTLMVTAATSNASVQQALTLTVQ
jgi:hypothetical protein